MRLLLPAAIFLAASAGCTADRQPAPGAGDVPAGTPAPAPAPARVAANGGPPGVPGAFQGRYAMDQAACGQSGHESHLDIGGDTITFHEGSGPVLRTTGRGPELAITAALTGEGETREATYRFRLSPDGRTLTDVEGGLVRVRCD